MIRPVEEVLTIMATLPNLSYDQAKHWDGDDVTVQINLALPTPTGHVRVTGNHLFVRVQPDVQSTPLGQLDEGVLVECWGQVADWTLVRYGELCGWSATKYLQQE